MKGTISEDGELLITRGPNEFWKSQECPYSAFTKKCGDWCPLFAEPGFNAKTKQTNIALCGKVEWAFDEFQDKRE